MFKDIDAMRNNDWKMPEAPTPVIIIYDQLMKIATNQVFFLVVTSCTRVPLFSKYESRRYG